MGGQRHPLRTQTTGGAPESPRRPHRPPPGSDEGLRRTTSGFSGLDPQFCRGNEQPVFGTRQPVGQTRNDTEGEWDQVPRSGQERTLGLSPYTTHRHESLRGVPDFLSPDPT